MCEQIRHTLLRNSEHYLDWVDCVPSTINKSWYHDTPIWTLLLYPVHGMNLTLIQHTWSPKFKHKSHCSGCGVAMGCYGHFIVSEADIMTSQCYGCYCFTAYAQTWAGHLSTPWQHEFTEIMCCQSINNLLDFNAICCIFLLNNSIYIIRRNCRVGTVFVVHIKC